MIRAGRGWALLTLLAAVLGVMIDLVLVILGVAISEPGVAAPLGIRLWRFVSFFTIQSNLLVIITMLPLIINPRHDGPRWRVLRLDAVVMITVTGLVHALLLRPLGISLSGWGVVADTLLHVVVPVLTVVGWVIFGPRRRIEPRTVAWSLLWPVGWLIYTLLIGGLTGWYPYPFLDIETEGIGQVAITCGAIAVLFTGLAWICWRLDRALPPWGRSA